MTRVALACSEPLQRRMAGIGIRYAEMARGLAAAGHEVVLVTVGDPAAAAALELPVQRVCRPRERGAVSDCDVLVVQGRAVTPLLDRAGDRAVVVDLYDPWLVENLHYGRSLGEGAYRRDLQGWSAQLERGDLFLASNEKQRLFYLGMLTLIGRIAPAQSSDYQEQGQLVAVAPFAFPPTLPEHRVVLPALNPGTFRILFGCLYDWLDPWPLLEALQLRESAPWELLFAATPFPESTPQVRQQAVREWCQERGWWGSRVRLIEWTEAARRFDLFRDVDALVVTDGCELESQLALRTRVLEAGAAGCPVVVTDGGATAELVRSYGLGHVVDAGDPEAIAAALERLASGADAYAIAHGSARLHAALQRDRALAALIEYCRRPWRSPRPSRKPLRVPSWMRAAFP